MIVQPKQATTQFVGSQMGRGQHARTRMPCRSCVVKSLFLGCIAVWMGLPETMPVRADWICANVAKPITIPCLDQQNTLSKLSAGGTEYSANPSPAVTDGQSDTRVRRHTCVPLQSPEWVSKFVSRMTLQPFFKTSRSTPLKLRRKAPRFHPLGSTSYSSTWQPNTNMCGHSSAV